MPSTTVEAKAFRVVCRSICKDAGIHAATSRSKARAQAFLSATCVGYRVTWGDFEVTRAPEYDAWARGWDHSFGVGEDFVKSELEEVAR